MALVVSVPLNTMLADLDETLRSLLKRELERHGFDGVEIAFDAPAREWSGQLSSPTVNLFLYDLRESQEAGANEWISDRPGNGQAREMRPPMMMECSYAVTAWTQAVEDEHRLLSQVLAVLFAFPSLPADVMPQRLQRLAERYPIERPDRAAEGRRQGRLLERRRRPVQGVAGLRRDDRLRVRHRVRARAGGAHADRVHAARGRAGAHDRRDAPLRRHGRRRGRRAGRRRVGRAPRARAARHRPARTGASCFDRVPSGAHTLRRAHARRRRGEGGRRRPRRKRGSSSARRKAK